MVVFLFHADTIQSTCKFAHYSFVHLKIQQESKTKIRRMRLRFSNDCCAKQICTRSIWILNTNQNLLNETRHTIVASGLGWRKIRIGCDNMLLIRNGYAIEVSQSVQIYKVKCSNIGVLLSFNLVEIFKAQIKSIVCNVLLRCVKHFSVFINGLSGAKIKQKPPSALKLFFFWINKTTLSSHTSSRIYEILFL